MERQEELRESDSLALRLKVKRLEAKNTALTTSLDAKVCYKFQIFCLL